MHILYKAANAAYTTLKGGFGMCHKTGKNDTKSKTVKPGDIKGKLEIPDTRKRKDGPGGN